MGENSNNLVSVGEKRPAEAETDDKRDDFVTKKKRRVEKVEEMRRVAEICLVLSTMGKLRGGRSPTEVEKELMVEAREKLVALCGEMAPKDVVSKEAVRVLIEELGLNNSKAKEPRLGFRPPVVSIKEKMELSKRKMEESKKFTAQSGAYSSQMLQAGGPGPKPDSHGAFVHAPHRYPPDRPSTAAVSSGCSETISPTIRVSTLPSTSSSNLPTNEVQSAAQSRVPPGSSSERDTSLARTEVVHFRLDGRTNMATYRANSSGDLLPEKAFSYSPQLQSGAVAKLGLVSKVDKVGGSMETSTSQLAQAQRDRNSTSPGIQTRYVNIQSANQRPQVVNFMQAPSHNNHNDIAKNVKNFLQPRIPEHPNWTPPSTDYMNKILNCQACGVAINDVESLLVCDACERGTHLKCLHSFNQKGIPKLEWHCPRCLISNNGKPFPPKYGRVTRNISAPKVSTNAGGGPVSSEKVGNTDQKVNNTRVTANGNPGSLHSVKFGHTGNNHIEAASGLKQSDASELQEAKRSESKTKVDENHISDSKLLPKDATGVVCAQSLSGQPNRSPVKQFQNSESSPCNTDSSISEQKSVPKSDFGNSSSDTIPETCTDSNHKSQVSGPSQDVGKGMPQKSADIRENQCHKDKTSDLRETTEGKPENDVRKDEEDAAQTISVGVITIANGARDHNKSSLGGLHSVDWVGDILQVVDEKAYYNSCRVNGMVYKLQDHALFRSNNGNLRPSKIQALWEDTRTGSRWAIVNSCYFPSDLPEVVGRPCPPESNEVYEANHGSTVRAGLIQGSCDVLPPEKFKEETESRIHLDDEHCEMQPIYLCRWFYDESKGLFRSVTD